MLHHSHHSLPLAQLLKIVLALCSPLLPKRNTIMLVVCSSFWEWLFLPVSPPFPMPFWKGEGPRKNWDKVQVLWICRGVEVVTRGLGPLGR